MQKIASKHLRETLFVPDQEALFKRKLIKPYAYSQDFVDSVCISPMSSLMRSSDMYMHHNMCVVKTILNSWATSHRYHEKVLLLCIMGCKNRRDELEHYMRCPVLWRIVAESTRAPVCNTCAGRMGFSSELAPESNIGSGQLKLHLKQLGIAYTVYHTLRNANSPIT